jgi:hypothetical protein
LILQKLRDRQFAQRAAEAASFSNPHRCSCGRPAAPAYVNAVSSKISRNEARTMVSSKDPNCCITYDETTGK